MLKKVISEYGGAIGAIVVLAALIGLVIFLIGTNDTSIVGKALKDVITNMQTSLTPTP